MTSGDSGLRLVDFLDHIEEASRLAREYVAGMSEESFLKDRRTQQAVVLNLMTIGEAAARIASEHKEFAAAHPEIPWVQMRGMRNRMAHGYFDIALDIVWQTVQSSLPDLQIHVAAALQKLKQSDPQRDG
ncbi:MAG: HepT-like ribonuclease domain-containing protein [Steroidobacteraceae bacterium]